MNKIDINNLDLRSGDKIGVNQLVNVKTDYNNSEIKIFKPFVHCHLHTFYSILDGAGSIDNYIKLAKKFNHPAICITDHGSVAGTFEFWKKCKKAGIKPIIGCEFYVNDSMGDYEEDKEDGGNAHQIALVKNKEGYVNLNKLVYKSFADGFFRRGRIKTDWLIENKEGLVVTTACMGSYIGKLLRNGKTAEAESYFKRLKDAFGEDFYAEIQLNELAFQKRYNSFIIELATKYKVKIILTSDVHYALPEDAELQDTLLAINRKKQLGQSWKFDIRHLYYASSEDIYEFNYKFGYDYNRAFIDMCLDNTLEIANKCNFDFETGVEKYPRYEPTQDVIDACKTSDSTEIIKKIAFSKLKKKLQKYSENGIVKIDNEKIKEYVDRLNYEIAVIEDKKMLDYFLVNWEIIRDYRSRGYDIGPGRGCFVSGSRVKMQEGMFCPIESINIGNIVIDAFGEAKKVLDVLEYDIDEDIVELSFDNGKKITCTLDHEILTKNRGWVKANELNENDDVCEIEDSKFLKLISKKIFSYKGKVHDLTIEGSHSYNIEGVSVHNSAAGCLLTWCLDITKIDPVRFGLYFERFLNPDRKSSPDLDIDYQADTDFITEEFLIKKYGRERILHVSTFSTFNEKGCIKDVVRAHHGEDATGYDSVVFQITKEMPDWSKVDFTLKDWFEQWPKEKECSPAVRQWLLDPSNKKILEQTLKLQGQIRGIGQHAAGVVITPTECWNDVPTNIIPKEKSIVTAFSEADGSSKDLSELGILKLDMLKLTTLNIIREACELIKKSKGIDLKDTLDNLDLNDLNLYAELRLGVNHGIFQFESSGMNALIKGVKVENFDELVAVNAMYRPGPMGIGAHEQYIKNKFNPKNITYLHPTLEEILGKTNGVMIYQEQVMFIANKIGGMNLGEGDLLRRYMDKAAKLIDKESKGEQLTEDEKNSGDYKNFEKYWNKFLQGAFKLGLNIETVNEIKGWMIKYLGYSFNKCLTKNHVVESEERGKINILDVKIGEKIKCYNELTKNDEFNKVKDIHFNGVKKIYRIKTKSGKVLECTLDHKIMTNEGLKPLSEILENKVLIQSNNVGFEEIIECVEIGCEETLDLEIDSEFHNFYANDICVSNSHCLSYSYIASQTLFLKHYYPTEFYAALFNHPKKGSGTDAKEKERIWLTSALAAAMSKGIKILPPSKKSGWDWTMTGDKEISMGFSGINGLGDKAYDELMNLIAKSGETFSSIKLHKFFNLPFSTFNKTAFGVCVKAGVFDDWSESREYLVELKSKKKKKETPGQLALFDLNSDEFNPIIKSDNFPKTTDIEKKVQFIEVCNFDLDKIGEISKIRAELYEKTGRIIESILNFSENDYYYFFLDNVQEAISEKGGTYLNIKIGDGISNTGMRVFSPRNKKDTDVYELIKANAQSKGVFISEFVKNAKGFINFKQNAQFKRIK